MSRDEELDSEFRMMPPCICAPFKHTNTHVHQRICPTFSLSVRSEDWGEGFVISIKFRSDLVKFPREEKKDRDSIGQERRVSSPRKPLEIIPTQVNCFQKALSSYLPPEWSSKEKGVECSLSRSLGCGVFYHWRVAWFWTVSPAGIGNSHSFSQIVF